MLDPMDITVRDLDAGRADPAAVTGTLCDAPLMDVMPGMIANGTRHAGVGGDGEPAFSTGIHQYRVASTAGGPRVAFVATMHADVDAFLVAALAGAHDGLAPGLSPRSHPDHYGAFVTDPHGRHIEAVCHRVEATT
ncbi:MAG TPA: VOC family protein [Lysobacter sp.]|nr:VOC family protein [Lysobacter sp.]